MTSGVSPARVIRELCIHTMAMAARSQAQLTLVDLPSEYQIRKGDWNGRALRLVTEIYQGQGRLSRLHVARIESEEGATASLTVLGLPLAATEAPIFGADLVAFGGSFSTVILDVIPVASPLAQDACDQLANARRGLHQAGEPRTLSGDAASPFSPEVAIVSPSSGSARSDASDSLTAAYEVYLDIFFQQLERAGDGPLRDSHRHGDSRGDSHGSTARARESQIRFLRQLAGVKKQMKALTKLFGDEWTRAYFDDVFLSPHAVQ